MPCIFSKGILRGSHGRDRMVVGFRTTYAKFENRSGKVYSIQILYDKVSQWLAEGQQFSQGTPVSSTNKTDCHDITEILLKVALNTITLTLNKGTAKI